MRAKNITIGTVYHITLGRNEVLGEVVAETENGWEVRLTASDKVIKVNSEERFLRKARTITTISEEQPETEPVAETTTEVDATAETNEIATEPQKKRGGALGAMSGIDAAHRVLLEIGKPLNVRQIAEAAIERGYCDLRGKTPHATISSALQRDIRDKQEKSRFCKVSKGLFAAVECQNE